MSNIALSGPTGKVGTAVLTLARECNVPIRALARDPARLRVPAGATVPFDFSDRSTYARALEAVETLILVSPSTPQQIEVDSAVVDAAGAAGVAHVIRLSGAGAEGGGGRFAEQHRAIDRYVGANARGATVVRATFFMENAFGLAHAISAGTYPAPTTDARIGQIAVDDIAAVLLAVAIAPATHRGTTYTVTGPAAYTGDEIAAAFAEATGHPVRYVDVPERAFREKLVGMGLDPWTADGLVEAYRFVRAGGTAATTEDVRRITGRSPIDFATWARKHASAFLANAAV